MNRYLTKSTQAHLPDDDRCCLEEVRGLSDLLSFAPCLYSVAPMENGRAYGILARLMRLLKVIS